MILLAAVNWKAVKIVFGAVVDVVADVVHDPGITAVFSVANTAGVQEHVEIAKQSA